jgi:hypothetical protein
MEKEIAPGIFISVITKSRWLQRTESLKGEDLQHFMQHCNRVKNTNIIIEHIFGVQKDKFVKALRELEPKFNENDDFYAVRYAPSI